MVTRAEHRTRTLRALSQAAIDAMESGGPDVALEDIAERAGVAKRTVYRWVDSKDDLMFIHPVLWLGMFDEAVQAIADLPLAERIAAGASAVCASVDDDPEPVLRSMRLVMQYPQLYRGYASVSQEWINRMASEVGRGADGEGNRFRERVIGSAVMGVIDAALFEWADQSSALKLGELVAQGLEHLAPLLSETLPES